MNFKNFYKLFTIEDNYNIHKTLGVLSLSNFIYRYYLLIVYNNMNFDNNSKFQIYSIVFIHSLLSLSSLIFKVPYKRHNNLPLIYKEFRAHSIIFGLRSIICFFLIYLDLHRMYNILVINLTMIMADIFSKLYKVDSTTMRKMPFGENVSQETKLKVTKIHSAQQFGATTLMMINMESAFSPLFAIQLSAFLMTLVRKSIIKEIEWHRIYLLSLLINIFVFKSFSNQFDMFYVLFTTILSFNLRSNYNLNKYIIWNTFLIPYLFIEKRNYLKESYNLVLINIIIIIYLFKQIFITKDLWY